MVGFAQWSQNLPLDTLYTNEGLISLAGVHTSGERVFVSGMKADYNYGLYYSDNYGGKWKEVATNESAGAYSVFANTKKNTIYSYGSSLFGVKALKKSVDNGLNWSLQEADYAAISASFIPTNFAAINDTLILTSTAKKVGMFKSVDGGATWSSFATFSDGDGNKSLDKVIAYKDYFYLVSGTNGKGVFRSHRDSTSWELFYDAENIGGSVYGLEITPEGRIIIVRSKEIFYSDDEGENWVTKTKQELGISNSGTIAITSLVGNRLLLSIQDSGAEGSRIIMLNEAITSSENISSSFTGYGNKSVLTTAHSTTNYVFATRNNEKAKLWVYNASKSGVSNEELANPHQFSLSQNYPNPFNPTTNIRFTLQQAGTVSLKVFNMLGQEVATLVNGRIGAGVQTVEFDASNLASGVYLYRLQAGNKIQTNKMLLIK